jgi:hypothetical protein
MVMLMSLTGKWIELIHKVATGSWKIKILIAPVVGLSYLALICLFIFLSFLVDNILHLPKIFCSPWTIIIGTPIIIAGFILNVFFRFSFLKGQGNTCALQPATQAGH